MNNRRVSRSRTLGLLILALLSAACGTPTAGPATPPTASATPVPAVPTPSPTPLPELLLVGEAGEALTSALQSWAGQRGWVLRTAGDHPDLRPDTAAAVLAGPQGEAALTDLSQAGLPTVTVDLEIAAAGPRLSTVGRPGARADQAGFLAGATAALITRSGWVGLIGDSAGQSAFEHGLRYLCVRCSPVVLEPAAATVEAFRTKTVDVVAVLPGAQAGQAGRALSGQGFWLVLVDQPADGFAPAEVAAQVTFEPDAMVIAALEALLEGSPGQAWPYSAELGSLRLAQGPPEALSPGRLQVLSAVLQALAAGSLDPGVGSATPP